MTLEELAQAAGVSAGLISQIERGLGNPSLSTLHKLARALGISITTFFEAPPRLRRILVRKGERMKLALPGPGHEGLTYEVLTPDFRGKMALFLTQIPGRWDNQDQQFIGIGEETIHILRGRLEVHVASETFVLEAGDTVTYDDSVPHWFRNPADESVHLINALTPPPL